MTDKDPYTDAIDSLAGYAWMTELETRMIGSWVVADNLIGLMVLFEDSRRAFQDLPPAVSNITGMSKQAVESEQPEPEHSYEVEETILAAMKERIHEIAAKNRPDTTLDDVSNYEVVKAIEAIALNKGQ